MGEEIESLARRFPQYQATIRRLCACDPNFRSICDDHRDVKRALEHWEAASPEAPGMVADYRQILAELEAEAFEIVQTFEEARGPR
jgi:hypothetical protein